MFFSPKWKKEARLLLKGGRKFLNYKRDLLKKNVKAARDDQEKASEQFKDALTKLKEIYAFDGGELERAYRQLDSEYKDSMSRASNVRKRVAEVETVGTDLCTEWEAEIGEIMNSYPGFRVGRIFPYFNFQAGRPGRIVLYHLDAEGRRNR